VQGELSQPGPNLARRMAGRLQGWYYGETDTAIPRVSRCRRNWTSGHLPQRRWQRIAPRCTPRPARRSTPRTTTGDIVADCELERPSGRCGRGAMPSGAEEAARLRL